MPDQNSSHVLYALGWALFLGVSWTWVIGMVAPTLFLLKWGWLGFVLFATPNVIGAAAMGWTITKRGISRAQTLRHGNALRVFSVVTILYHFFVVGWVALRLMTPTVAAICWVTVGVMLILALQFEKRPNMRDFNLAVLGISVVLCLMVVLMVTEGLSTAVPARIDEDGKPLDQIGAGWLNYVTMGSIVLFGFAFCPYMDPTFHRARQALNTGMGRFAFTLGFGVVFFSAILLTTQYSGFLAIFFTEGAHGQLITGTLHTTMIGFYILIQASITVWFHWRELGKSDGRSVLSGHPMLKRWKIGWIMAILGTGILVGGRLLPMDTLVLNMRPGEWVYLGFLSMYGLWFPAYWWWFAMGRGKCEKPSRFKLTAFVVVGMLAWPVYGICFMLNSYLWLPLAVIFVMGSRLLADRLINTKAAT